MQEVENPAIWLFGKKIPLSGGDAICEKRWMDEEKGETEQRISTDAQSQSQVPSVVDGEVAEKSETSKLMKESSFGTCDSQRKTLKKPNKILPCPRCDSMDTKFCYYNNYNVKQPRHFCRACQRYWTAGGSMRNMLVGAGRRKNKSKSAGCRYRHIMISRALGGEKVDVLDFNSIGTVPDNECSSASSISISNSDDNVSKNFTLREQKAIPSLPGIPWPHPWILPVPSPALYSPAAFWTWNVPLVSSHQPSSTDGIKTSGATTEEEKETKSSKQGNSCLVVPKILRINDPREAAKSSIWTSLGISIDSNAKEALSGGFKQKGVEKVRDDEKLPALQANPAASSRSLSFRDNY